jgi:hypothetical protein
MIKTCPYCASTAFEDMAVCYGCLQPFVPADDEVELLIEEPSEAALRREDTPPAIRFHVTVADIFGYDIYLNRTEGARLTIGCARDNNIVLPHTASRRHVLSLCYVQGLVWAEDKGSTQQALLEDVPLAGTRHMKQGMTLKVGEAKIELIED